MRVCPIEELTTMEGLSQDGETEREQECKGSEEEGEEEKSEDGKEGCSEGRVSVGRRSPKEPTLMEREDRERTHCPLPQLVSTL